MHVLLISSSPYLHPETPLWGSFQFSQLMALRSEGLTVGLLSPAGRSARKLLEIAFGPGAYAGDERVLTNTGVDWFPLAALAQRQCFVSTGRRLFREYVRRYGLPDIVHAHNAVHAGSLALVLKREFGVGTVLTEHSSWIGRGRYQGRMAKIIESVYKEVDTCLAVSNSLALNMRRNYSASFVSVVANVLGQNFALNNELCSISADKTQLRLVNVGSLDANKNQQLLLETVRLLVDKGLDVTLRLVGEGPSRGALKVLADKLNISARVEFEGRVPTERVLECFREADVFCLSSVRETFGVVLIESASVGLPVVTTPCGGCDDVVIDSLLGAILGAHCPEEFASTILAVHSCNSQEAINARSKLVKERYGDTALAARLTKIYRAIQE